MSDEVDIPEVEPGFTALYLSVGESAEVLGTYRTRFNSLLQNEWVCPPDVTLMYSSGYASGMSGWEPNRLRKFAIEAGFLDEEGHPTGVSLKYRSRDALLSLQRLASEDYVASPKLYFGARLVAETYGHRLISLFNARREGRFIPADIVISTRFGWAEERVLQHGRSNGILEERDIDAWVITRATQHELDPYPDWVLQRIQGVDTLSGREREAPPRPKIKKELVRAGFPFPDPPERE